MEINTLIPTAQTAADYADLFMLLSIGFDIPARELTAAILDGSFLQDLEDCCQSICPIDDTREAAPALVEFAHTLIGFIKSDCGQTDDAEAFYHGVNQEYTRLFLSPKHEEIAIFESVFLHPKDTAMFINPTAMHMEQLFRHNGFPFPEKSTIPGDHMAMELRYMAYLCSAYRIALDHAATAADEGNAAGEEDAAVTRIAAALSELMDSHLKRRFSGFMNAVKEKSEHPVYVILAQAGIIAGNTPDL